MTDNEKWEQNIVPLRVHINAWAVAAVVVGLLQFKAVEANPSEFYESLRWLTLLVSGFGLHIALQHSFLGWSLLFFAMAALFYPMLPLFQLSRSTWFPLNVASGVTLIASAFLLRWNTESRWITLPRDVIDKSASLAVFTIVWGFILHVMVVLALLPIAYLVSGDEQLADDWKRWRDANLLLVGVVTVAAVWLYHCLSSPAAVRQFLTEPSGWPPAIRRP